ncbi:MAG TPA: dihydrofolate reductase family protein [Solirubrobacterales bacterium]|nr:dihydrofolate reductase family protein [Solirubrobacterales bacterium]
MRRLFPDAGETTVADEVSQLDLVPRAREDRPYTITNFVLTLDGRATIAGRSGPIGSDADTELLVALRTRVDAVMIGAGTMRAERYGRVVGDPAKRERRERDGLAHDPLMVLVSGRLDLPWDAPLFTEGSGQVLICTAADTDPPETATPVEVIRHPDGVDLVALMRTLRGDHGVRALLSEGGPNLHAQLIDANLVDELFVTHAPKLAGGPGPGLVEGLTERARDLELASLLYEESTGELFARYRTNVTG